MFHDESVIYLCGFENLSFDNARNELILPVTSTAVLQIIHNAVC